MSKFKDLDIGDAFSYKDNYFVKIKRRVRGGEPANAIVRVEDKDIYVYVPDSVKVQLDG